MDKIEAIEHRLGGFYYLEDSSGFYYDGGRVQQQDIRTLLMEVYRLRSELCAFRDAVAEHRVVVPAGADHGPEVEVANRRLWELAGVSLLEDSDD